MRWIPKLPIIVERITVAIGQGLGLGQSCISLFCRANQFIDKTDTVLDAIWRVANNLLGLATVFNLGTIR